MWNPFFPFLPLFIELWGQDVVWASVIVAQDKYRCFPASLYPLPAQLRVWVTLSEKANCLLSVFIHLYVRIWLETHDCDMFRPVCGKYLRFTGLYCTDFSPIMFITSRRYLAISRRGLDPRVGNHCSTTPQNHELKNPQGTVLQSCCIGLFCRGLAFTVSTHHFLSRTVVFAEFPE